MEPESKQEVNPNLPLYIKRPEPNVAEQKLSTKTSAIFDFAEAEGLNMGIEKKRTLISNMGAPGYLRKIYGEGDVPQADIMKRILRRGFEPADVQVQKEEPKIEIPKEKLVDLPEKIEVVEGDKLEEVLAKALET